MSIINSIIQHIAEQPVYYSCNTLIFWMWCAFMDVTLELKRKLYVAIPVRLLMTLLYFVPGLLPYLSTISFFLLIFDLVFQAVFLYSDELRRKLIVVTAIMLTMLVSELVNMYLFFYPEYIQGGALSVSANKQIQLFSVYIFIQIAIFFTVAVIMKKSDNKRKYPMSYSLVILIPFLIEIFLIYFWTKTLIGDTHEQARFILVVIFFCILGNSAVFFSVAATQKRKELKVENESLEKLVAVQEAYYFTLAEQYENIRKLRHDIANHMYTINILIEDGKADEAAEYAKELRNEGDYSTLIGECQNHVLGAFLHHRISELAAKGIKTDAKIILPQSIDISNCELISIFGNLLDNAAEACANIDDAVISIVSEIRGSYLFVSVVNPVFETAQVKKRRIPELERGLGNKILLNFSEKYDGEFTRKKYDGHYSATILLKAYTTV